MTVVLAFDGDDAGRKATDMAMLTVLNLSDTEAAFLRAFVVEGKPFAECVGLLGNRELADELSFWSELDRSAPVPDWWHEMCQDHRTACLSEVTRRSRKVNDQGGNQYIKSFNDANGISSVLESHGYRGIPGRTVRCPKHDDSTPSLSISKDDRVCYCFNQSCVLWGSGHGTDAYGLQKILSE